MTFKLEDIRGSIVPLVTPFKRDGSIDIPALRRLIDWQIENGAHGISVTGTTGEPSALSLDERKQVMDVASDASAGRVPFVPGTGTNNLQETLELTRHAERLNANAALVIVPYYMRPSQEGLYRYFRKVAEHSRLPIIVYNIPGRTAVNMSPVTLGRLRKDAPNIVGVKESNTDFAHFSQVFDACGRDFRVYSGIELLTYPVLAIGGVGYVSATANVLPQQVASLYDHHAAGRIAQALDLHYWLLPMNEVLFIETNPGPLKWAMGRMGLIEPHYRLPLCEPSKENQDRIDAVLNSYGLIPAMKAVR